MRLSVKNMVCNRCIMVVENELQKLGFKTGNITLGEVELMADSLNEADTQLIRANLEKLGFELLEDKKQITVAQIKAAIIDLVHYQDGALKINLSDFLSEKLAMDYSQLSTVFSMLEKNTIEHYYIQQKIERAKELLSYGEQTLSEIAYVLNYSSVAHLSAQFKKETGITPSQFKQNLKRRTLDQL